MTGVVLKLVRPLCGRGITCIERTLTHSPVFFLQLRSSCFHACGTLRLNHRGVPSEVRMILKKGEQRVVPLDDTIKVVQ